MYKFVLDVKYQNNITVSKPAIQLCKLLSDSSMSLNQNTCCVQQFCHLSKTL